VSVSVSVSVQGNWTGTGLGYPPWVWDRIRSDLYAGADMINEDDAVISECEMTVFSRSVGDNVVMAIEKAQELVEEDNVHVLIGMVESLISLTELTKLWKIPLLATYETQDVHSSFSGEAEYLMNVAPYVLVLTLTLHLLFKFKPVSVSVLQA